MASTNTPEFSLFEQSNDGGNAQKGIPLEIASPSINTQNVVQNTSLPDPLGTQIPQPQISDIADVAQKGDAIDKLVVIVTLINLILNTLASISGLIYFVAGLALMDSVMMIYSLSKQYPGVGIYSLILLIYSLLSLYTSLKVINRSRSAYYLSLFLSFSTIIIIPILFYIFITPFINNFSDVAAGNMIDLSVYEFIRNPVSIISFVVFAGLIFLRGRFNNPDKPLGNSAKIFLGISSLLLILPTVVIVGNSFIKAMDTDTGYEEVSNRVSFHIYTPRVMPDGYDYALKYVYFDDLWGFGEGVMVLFAPHSHPLDIVSISQVGLMDGFQLDQYIAYTKREEMVVEQVNIDNAKSDTAYLVSFSGNEEEIGGNVLYIHTEDDVLINIKASLEVDKNDLFEFAESLE